jgi:hypothetical protein
MAGIPIVQSTTTSAYSFHIQAECYSQKVNIINKDNANGEAWRDWSIIIGVIAI